MCIHLETARTKQIGGAILAWLISSLLFLLLAAFLIGRLRLGGQWIGGASAAVVFLSSAAAGIFLFLGRKGERPWIPALLLWVVIASSLLMLGFLINSDAVSLSGLLRVLLCSLLGCFCGILLNASPNKNRKRGRIRKRSKLT